LASVTTVLQQWYFEKQNLGFVPDHKHLFDALLHIWHDKGMPLHGSCFDKSLPNEPWMKSTTAVIEALAEAKSWNRYDERRDTSFDSYFQSINWTSN